MVRHLWWPMAQAADLPGVPSYDVLKKWRRRGHLPSVHKCPRTGVLLVDIAEIQRRSLRMHARI
jgi:hypothetical protein